MGISRAIPRIAHSRLTETILRYSLPDDAGLTSGQENMPVSSNGDGGQPLLSVIVPVFNECRTVEALLLRVLAVPLPKQVVAIDDGSGDCSAGVLQRLAGKRAIDLVRHPENRGKGAAIRSGLEQARGEIVVIQDADLEYDPSEYHRLLAPFFIDPGCTVVYGSRFRGDAQQMSPWHRFGNRLVTRTFNLAYGTNLTDMETCYKAIRRRALVDITLESDRWGFDPEITAKLVRAGHTIVEVPVDYSGRDIRHGKKLRWRDGFSVLRAILRYRFAD
jgi:glycosyltransferase involved in cell wall biosynthesis